MFSVPHHCSERCHSSQAILDVRCSGKHRHVHLQIEPPCGRPVVVGLVQEDGAIVLRAMAWWGTVFHLVAHYLRRVVDWVVSVLLQHYNKWRERDEAKPVKY